MFCPLLQSWRLPLLKLRKPYLDLKSKTIGSLDSLAYAQPHN
jgi:hypothetical protein